MSLSSFASSIAGDVTGALSAVGGALNGVPAKVNPPQVLVGSIVSLGDPETKTPFFFSEFELPSRLSFGSYQMSAAHNFIGGGRAVDLYGAQPHPIEVTGELFDLGDKPPTISTTGMQRPQWDAKLNTAMQRLQLLHGLCTRGQKVLFQFHQFKFWCVVMDTTFDALQWHDATFSIKLEVLYHNLDKGVTVDPLQAAKLNPPAQEGLLHKFTTFMSNMNGYLAQANNIINAANAVVVGLKTNPGAVLLGGVAFVPGTAQVEAFISRAQVAAASMNQLNTTLFPQYALDMTNAQPYNSLDSVAYTKYLTPSTQVIKNNLALHSSWLVNDFPKLASPNPGLNITRSPILTAVAATSGHRALMGLSDMHKTMQKIVQPSRSYYLQVNNPNLSKLALQVYGDPSKWQVIAQANNLTNMINTGVYNLIIPYADQITGSTPTLSASTSGGT